MLNGSVDDITLIAANIKHHVTALTGLYDSLTANDERRDGSAPIEPKTTAETVIETEIETVESDEAIAGAREAESTGAEGAAAVATALDADTALVDPLDAAVADAPDAVTALVTDPSGAAVAVAAAPDADTALVTDPSDAAAVAAAPNADLVDPADLADPSDAPSFVFTNALEGGAFGSADELSLEDIFDGQVPMDMLELAHLADPVTPPNAPDQAFDARRGWNSPSKRRKVAYPVWHVKGTGTNPPSDASREVASHSLPREWLTPYDFGATPADPWSPPRDMGSKPKWTPNEIQLIQVGVDAGLETDCIVHLLTTHGNVMVHLNRPVEGIRRKASKMRKVALSNGDPLLFLNRICV